MSPEVVAAALMAAIAVGCAVHMVLYSPRRMEGRLRPYLVLARTRLGTMRPVSVSETLPGRSGVYEVFGPLVRRTADRLAGLIDAAGANATALRIRQAGKKQSVEEYRTRQLAFTVGGLVGGVFLGLLVGASTVLVLVMGAAGAWWGAVWLRSQLDRAIRNRRERMRADLYTVCQLLAVYVKAGSTPIGAMQRLVARMSSPIGYELGAAVAQIRSGSVPQEVLADTARTTPEPAAARLYRLLGSTWETGGDPSALLSLSEDLRSARREELQRTMARRRVAMVVPLVAVMAPVMILFIAAAIPRIVFGGFR